MVIAALARQVRLAANSPSDAGWALAADVLVAQAPGKKRFQIELLDPPTRAKVLAALVGLIILMLGMMALAWLGARWARSYGRRTPRWSEQRKTTLYDADDWASKPLRPANGEQTDPNAPE